MNATLLRKMTGEELLVLNITHGWATATAVGAELDRRARLCPPRKQATRIDWSSRIFAARNSARLAMAA